MEEDEWTSVVRVAGESAEDLFFQAIHDFESWLIAEGKTDVLLASSDIAVVEVVTPEGPGLIVKVRRLALDPTQLHQSDEPAA